MANLRTSETFKMQKVVVCLKGQPTTVHVLFISWSWKFHSPNRARDLRFPLARRVSNYYFHSLSECQTRIDEWASDKGKPCCMVILLSLLAKVVTGNIAENISVNSDMLFIQKTKQTEKKTTTTTNPLQIILKRKEIEAILSGWSSVQEVVNLEGCKTKKKKTTKN